MRAAPSRRSDREPSLTSRWNGVRRRLGSRAAAHSLLRAGAAVVRGPRAARLANVAPEPVTQTVEAKPTDARYVTAWSRLVRTVLGTDVAADPSELNRELTNSAVEQARVQRAQSTLAAALSRGESLQQAIYATVANLAGAKEWQAAWALSEGVKQLPGGAGASTVGHAVLLHRRRQFHRVWNLVAGLSDDDLARYVPVEAVDGALAVGTAETRERAYRIAATPARLAHDVLVDLAGRFLAVGDRGRAAELAEELRSRAPLVELDERRSRSWTLIERWLERGPTHIPRGSVAVAVIDYQSPDQVLASGNGGDYVQTLAMLSNLARFSSVSFTGDDGLGEFATELQHRVRPNLRVPDPVAAVHLLAVNRDFSSDEDVPERTWMVAFGWHMHPLYDLRYDFPYHRNIRPLFVSFHINRLAMLTDEALDYLRAHGPVGCRDWTTVFLLLSAGVDAFFTGCLTTTVDAVFPRRDRVFTGGDAVGLIDIAQNAAGEVGANPRIYSHQDDRYRHMSLTDGLRAASDLLAEYQRGLERAVTRRLHAYLPLVSLGVPVTFKPWSSGDVRFAGLRGLRVGDRRLRQMQLTIRELVSQIMATVLDGADDDAVYDRWRELTASRVGDARARFAVPVDDESTTVDVDAAVSLARANSRRFGPHDRVDAATVSDVVLCFDQNLTAQAPVMIESLLVNASGPVRLWVLGRGLSETYIRWLADAFSSVPLTYLPCDHIDYGKVARMPARITVSTMDRLLLPHLLEDVDRAVYLDIDTLVLDDIGRLAHLDLGGMPIAARDSDVSEASEWRAAARRLRGIEATALLRRTGHAHGYGPAALNAGVLVLDLDRMRKDDFTRTYLGWVERYGLHDQDIMLAYVGPDRRVLEPRWNALPVLEDVDDPAVIHWASLGKPWEEQLTYAAGRWQEYAARLRARVAEPPPR